LGFSPVIQPVDGLIKVADYSTTRSGALRNLLTKETRRMLRRLSACGQISEACLDSDYATKILQTPQAEK
jgi:hypothetical protein